MDYVAPKPVELTESESELYSKIKNERDGDDWHEIADAMDALIKSLTDRGAIPKIRLELFTNPEYAETGSKSPQQGFESNGTSGNGIIRHPHFVKYLKYFIEGPELPKDAIDGLCKILNDDQGTSGMVIDQWRAHARASIREHAIDKYKAGTEFFRLGVEIGMDVYDARTLRDAAKSAR